MMTTDPPSPSLHNWDIRHAADVDWVPWGGQGNAKAKILAEADGYTIALVQAEAGYQSGAHEHDHPEFFYLLDGVVRNQGEIMNTGDAYAADVGSVHTDFEALASSTYISIFRL